MHVLRVMSERAWERVVRSGRIEPSPNEYPPYPAGTTVFVYRDDVPASFLLSRADELCEDGSPVHLVSLDVPVASRGRLEDDKSAFGIDGSLAHHGAIDRADDWVIHHVATFDCRQVKTVAT
jgi:hypothetical protein